jgi:cell division protease FtsH
VRKVSIVPRGHALGMTFQSPDTERYFYSEPYLRGRIAGMLGGRAAEQIAFGNVTTGAESDLEQATALARQMVGRWGMSERVGPTSLLPDPRREQLDFAMDGSGISPKARELVDVEVRRILDECGEEAHKLLLTERARLDALVTALLEAETLDDAAAHQASGLPLPRR